MLRHCAGRLSGVLPTGDVSRLGALSSWLRCCEVHMNEVVEGGGSKTAFVGDVIEHIRRCHERIVILHTGARALIERGHRDLQIARDRIQQAEAKAAAEKARADAAEAKFQQLAWLVRSQLLPAIEDE